MAFRLSRCVSSAFLCLWVPFLWGNGTVALAQSQPQTENEDTVTDGGTDSQDSTPADEAASDPTVIDDLQGSIASGVTGAGAWVDSFFATEHDNIENNKSRVRISLGGHAETGNDPGYRLKIKARLALPSVSKRLSLVAGGDGDDDSDPDQTKTDRAQDNYSGADEENASVGLQYFVVNSKKRNLSALAGLRIKTSGPVGVFGGRYRETLGLGSHYDLRFTQSALWLTDNGFALPTRFDLDRQLSDAVLSRTTLKGAWYESSSGYFYSASQSIIQKIDDKRGVRYSWNNAFRTSPKNRLQETNVQINYRQQVWRKWLIFEVTPQVALPRDRDYKVTPGIYAGFEVRFGG